MANHFFDLIAQRMPSTDRLFLRTAEGTRYSYGDLVAQSARYANALVALGVKPGDRVAAQLDKNPDVVFLYLGCVRAGAVFLPLNTAYTRHEIDYFVGDAEPRVLVVTPVRFDELSPVAAAHGALIETLGSDGAGTLPTKAAAAAASFTDAARGPDDLAALLYTSGTTGRSKGAMLTHNNLASNGQALATAWRFTRDDVLLHALPIFHTHGLFVAISVVMFSGASMIFLPKFDPEEILDLMPDATTMMGVPTFYTRLLLHDRLTRDAAAHMRLFVSGSAPLLADTHRQWSARTGHAILERYGMTETNMNTSNPFDGERRPGTVGFPLPGIQVRVSDPDSGRELPRGEIGMIEIKGPNVFKGYWRMPDKTAAEFRADGFFISGDLGSYDADGYLHIVGRGKDLVISGGYNVYPKEVESELDALPGVVESAVFGVPHPDFGEGVTAVVVLAKGATLTEADIHRDLADRLAKYKQPKRVFVVADLPRNTMGKVQKNVLRDSYKDIYQG